MDGKKEEGEIHENYNEKILKQIGGLDGLLEKGGSEIGEDEFDVGSVGSAGDVRENLLERIGVLCKEDVLDELAGVLVVLASCVFGEAHVQIGLEDLLLEEILLVEEQDDRRVHEPFVVADFLEEFEGFSHAVGLVVFVEEEVVFGEGDTEDGGGDVLEAVHPLLAFGALSAHVHHPIVHVVHVELCLCYPCRLRSAVDDVGFVGAIRGLLEAVDVVEEVLDAIDELVLRRSRQCCLDRRVLPQQLQIFRDLSIDVLTEILFQRQEFFGRLLGFGLQLKIKVGGGVDEGLHGADEVFVDDGLVGHSLFV